MRAGERLKVSEVVNGYTAFGFQNEASQLSAFLRGIGEREDSEAVFTPAHILSY